MLRFRTCLVRAALLGGLLLISSEAEAGESLRRTPVVVAVEKVSPAVVNISTVVRERVGLPFAFGGEDFFKDFFPDLFAREFTRTSLGSGVILDGSKGHIVTNHHVVTKASEIKVITAGQKEYEAKVIGSDPRSDLAILQIRPEGLLPDVPMGNSDDLMIGETLIAIGNPFGLSHTVTTGVVSALNRSVRAGDNVYRNFIQTDASINPGNSGGPLLTLEGDLIGINTAIYQKAQGIGFAIPINKVRRMVQELIRYGEVRVAWLGLEIQELTQDLKRHFFISSGEQGVLIKDVISEGPAEKAGLKRGDILISLGGIPVPSPAAYGEALSEFIPGEKLSLKSFRKGKESMTTVELSTFPLGQALDLFHRRLGIKVAELTQATKSRYGLEGGLSIEAISGNSEAQKIGLKSGDLIIKVNNQAVTNLEDFKKVIARIHHFPSIHLIVQRGAHGYSVTLPF